MTTTSRTTWNRKQPSPGPARNPAARPCSRRPAARSAVPGRRVIGRRVIGGASSAGAGCGSSTNVQGLRQQERPYHRPVSDRARFGRGIGRATAPRLASRARADRPRRGGIPAALREPAPRSGRRRSTTCTTTRSAARWASRSTTTGCARRSSALRGSPRRRPGSGDARAVLEEFSTRVAPHTVSAYHPRSFGYFTPPPLLASVAGEVLAQVAQQGIDIWHAGPVGAFVEEEVLRWLCDLVGYGEGSFGILTSGGVMANFIAMALVRDVHLSAGPRRAARRAGAPSRGSACTPRTRRISRSGEHSTSSASRPRRSSSCRPTTTSGCARRPSQGDPPRPGGGAHPIRDRRGRGPTNTGAVDRRRACRLARREGCGCTWTRRTARGAALRRATRGASRDSSADSVTVDPHKWFFQAYDIGGAMVRDGAPSARPSAGGGRSTTAAARERRPRRRGDAGGHDGHGRRPAQLLRSASRARAAGGRSSCGCPGSTSDDGFGRLVEANNDLAAHLAARFAASDDFEALPADPRCRGCFRHLPGAGRRRPSSTDTRTGSRGRSRPSGEGWLTTTRLRGATYLRAGILNHAVDDHQDVDDLLEILRRLASA